MVVAYETKWLVIITDVNLVMVVYVKLITLIVVCRDVVLSNDFFFMLWLGFVC
jgi:hypothetical protein